MAASMHGVDSIGILSRLASLGCEENIFSARASLACARGYQPQIDTL
ncbi:hypothetical protein OYC64_018464 [Pagothenia borchgrevinki]|uniref:Uncharacterized protein n=1 Tax=Pagothenia borchgrevinki TaxID=8213 RepID=A0ABD2GNT3_PAGBO